MITHKEEREIQKAEHASGGAGYILKEALIKGEQLGDGCGMFASWEFYEKRGFKKVAEKPFQDGSGNQSLVYEYVLKEDEYEKHHL